MARCLLWFRRNAWRARNLLVDNRMFVYFCKIREVKVISVSAQERVYLIRKESEPWYSGPPVVYSSGRPVLYSLRRPGLYSISRPAMSDLYRILQTTGTLCHCPTSKLAAVNLLGLVNNSIGCDAISAHHGASTNCIYSSHRATKYSTSWSHHAKQLGCPYTPRSQHMPCSITACPFPACTATLHVLLPSCSVILPCRFVIEPSLIRHWAFDDPSLSLRWSAIEPSLIRHWAFVDPPLSLLWSVTEPSLIRHWTIFEPSIANSSVQQYLRKGAMPPLPPLDPPLIYRAVYIRVVSLHSALVNPPLLFLVPKQHGSAGINFSSLDHRHREINILARIERSQKAIQISSVRAGEVRLARNGVLCRYSPGGVR